ncbi:UbiA family prenyltransferase [candidate division KSB1 bacterium]|nr:UbiA family prenyltransferase [candidate division KSB1 bacterium]
MKAKWFDFFFVLRPTLFFPVWTFALAGYWTQSRYGINTFYAHGFFDIGSIDFTLWCSIFLFTLVMGSVYLINQIEDVESDRLNNKLYLIANGDISIRQAYWETALLLAVAVVLTALKRWDLAAIMIVAFVVLGWLYSCRPFALKNHPIGSIVINLSGGYIVFGFGWMIAGGFSPRIFFYATPYALGLLAVYFFTTIPDIPGDGRVKKITPAVKWGKNAAIHFGLGAEVLAIFFAFLSRDLVILLPTVAMLPFFIKTAVSKSVKDVLRTNKYAVLFLSLAICYKFYLYFALILIVFIFSKWYYKKRFDLVYPSFKT